MRTAGLWGTYTPLSPWFCFLLVLRKHALFPLHQSMVSFQTSCGGSPLHSYIFTPVSIASWPGLSIFDPRFLWKDFFTSAHLCEPGHPSHWSSLVSHQLVVILGSDAYPWSNHIKGGDEAWAPEHGCWGQISSDLHVGKTAHEEHLQQKDQLSFNLIPIWEQNKPDPELPCRSQEEHFSGHCWKNVRFADRAALRGQPGCRASACWPMRI